MIPFPRGQRVTVSRYLALDWRFCNGMLRLRGDVSTTTVISASQHYSAILCVRHKQIRHITAPIKLRPYVRTVGVVSEGA